MMGRRLALRKGLAVSAAVLLLMGWGLLYLTNRVPGSSAGSVGSSPARPPSPMSTPPVQKTRKIPPIALNLSLPKAHLQTPLPTSPKPAQHNRTLLLQQCKFAEGTEVTGADVQVNTPHLPGS